MRRETISAGSGAVYEEQTSGRSAGKGVPNRITKFAHRLSGPGSEIPLGGSGCRRRRNIGSGNGLCGRRIHRADSLWDRLIDLRLAGLAGSLNLAGRDPRHAAPRKANGDTQGRNCQARSTEVRHWSLLTASNEILLSGDERDWRASLRQRPTGTVVTASERSLELG